MARPKTITKQQSFGKENKDLGSVFQQNAVAALTQFRKDIEASDPSNQQKAGVSNNISVDYQLITRIKHDVKEIKEHHDDAYTRKILDDLVNSPHLKKEFPEKHKQLVDVINKAQKGEKYETPKMKR